MIKQKADLAKISRVIMMSGAPCEDGTFCDTGRADATGGYCTAIAQAAAAAGMTPTSAPSLAPAPSSASAPEASTQANQECSATGMSQGRLSCCHHFGCLMAWLLESKHAQ